MLRHLVTNWLREQATEILKDQVTARGAEPHENEGQADAADCDLVVVFPSRGEAGGLIDRLSGVSTMKCDRFVERTGTLGSMGVAVVEVDGDFELLARATRDTVVLRKPRWLIGSGFAVALHEDLRKGHFVMARRIIDGDGSSVSTGVKMDSSDGIHAGTLLTRAHKPSSVQEKQKLTSTGALACDRQSAIVAEVGRILSTPTMTAHVVAETLLERPSTTLRNVTKHESWAGALGAAAGALMEQPSSAKELWNDKEQTLRLSDRLAGFLDGVIQNLK